MEHIGEDIPEFSEKVNVDYKKINSEEKKMKKIRLRVINTSTENIFRLYTKNLRR